ncbi:MAG TPA: hypothetical protein VD790_07520 [Thermoleophilaceae bacterium]|nr:hypothetical protein [Thermoleophilaceae bacterium]
MTPESIAGLKIPEQQLQELLDALAETHEDNVVPLFPLAVESEAA